MAESRVTKSYAEAFVLAPLVGSRVTKSYAEALVIIKGALATKTYAEVLVGVSPRRRARLYPINSPTF